MIRRLRIRAVITAGSVVAQLLKDRLAGEKSARNLHTLAHQELYGGSTDRE